MSELVNRLIIPTFIFEISIAPEEEGSATA